MIPVASASAEHGAEVAADGLDHPEGNLLVAVAQDSVQVAREQLPPLLEGGQPLSAQSLEPGRQEPAGDALVGVGPEVPELFFEHVGFSQAPVDGEERAEGLALLPLQVGPAPEQESAFAAHQPPGLPPALPEELGPMHLVHRGVRVPEHVELVVDDPGLRQVDPQALTEGFPHVHTDRPDALAVVGRQGLGTELIQRLPLSILPHPKGLAPLQVAHHGQELDALAQEELINPEIAHRLAGATGGPR